MGNWTTVRIVGTCEASEASEVSNTDSLIKCDYSNDKWNCLTGSSGICGLGQWLKPEFDAVGNLAERGYDVEDIAEVVRDLVELAPSLDLKVHVGGEYESKTCVKTINCKDGEVTIDEAEIESVGEISVAQMQANLMKQMRGF